ncbi:MAG: TonB-dependent receptor domain-containing protein, partial [Gammaproteobacteria bacterium]
ASAIYGTDAVGGVINFITRKDYQGIGLQGFTDVTEAGGGNIRRMSVTGGFGQLERDGYNLLLTASRAENKALRGDERSFVNTFQPERGVSVDTRGTPFATVFATSLAPTILSRTGTGPTLPGRTQAYNGINLLDLPGGAGCASVPGMGPYDELLWDSPGAAYGCAWDTGRAAVLQQPVTNTNFVARATFAKGAHQFFAEVVGSQVDTAKRFSAIQVQPSATNLTAAGFYPSTGEAYNSVFNAIAAVFPSIEANRGLPIAYRWRCMECGDREITTRTEAARILVGADGPLGDKWDYRVGLSQAYSESQSKLGSGYVYTARLNEVLGSGIVNPFLLPGQTQSRAALDALAGISARGVTLYGGKTILTQLDASLSGEVYRLPAGAVMLAVGTDLRREQYRFNGDAREAADRPQILGAAFDDVNTLNPVSRTVRALYAELLVPVTKTFEATFAGRQDHYTGFGNTFNPKITLRYQPSDKLLLRASYNTGFRAPAFNQLFNGITESPYSGRDLADPAKCGSLQVDSTKPGCEVVNPTILTGGRPDLGPETSKQASIGAVFEPLPGLSANVDVWEVRKEDTIDTLTLGTLLRNYDLFSDRFIRDAAGALVSIDQRWVNAGERQTRGVEVGLRGGGKLWEGVWGAGIDGSYLLKKRSRPLPNVDFGPSEIGRFLYTGDLGLRWKHTAYLSYRKGNWSGLLQNVFRDGYRDQVLPGVASGRVQPSKLDPTVDSYSIVHATVTYTGVKNLTLTAGVKNLFDRDPPFAITYDSVTGAGSTWEPRVADPRGRSFTLQAVYRFM